jgi:hypothetical protein
MMPQARIGNTFGLIDSEKDPMGYRRSKEKIEAARNWATFVTHNRHVIEAAGLPLVVTESIHHWDDFLMHGYLDHHHDPAGFTVDQLSNEQYAALIQLVESYFVRGYEYFTPLALKREEQQLFESRFSSK